MKRVESACVHQTLRFNAKEDTNLSFPLDFTFSFQKNNSVQSDDAGFTPSGYTLFLL